MLPQPVSPWRIELGSDIHDLRVSCWLREGVLPPETADLPDRQHVKD
jgi:hypothetical protein